MSSPPREHVERIRRERYYIGRGEQNPLAEDMHQAVNYLSQELYSKDVHFLMELVQAGTLGIWKRYIEHHNKKTGIVGPREHAAFLNMWLAYFLASGPVEVTSGSSADLGHAAATDDPGASSGGPARVTSSPIVVTPAGFSSEFTDLFHFDLDGIVDEALISQSTPAETRIIPNDVREVLADVLCHLQEPLDALVTDSALIKSRLASVQDRLPMDLLEDLSPSLYFDAFQQRYECITQQLTDRAEQRRWRQHCLADRDVIIAKKANLDDLITEPDKINGDVTQLRAQEEELLAQLAEVREEIALREKRLADIPAEIISRWKDLSDFTRAAYRRYQQAKPIPGSDEEDHQELENMNAIRNHAIAALMAYLGVDDN